MIEQLASGQHGALILGTQTTYLEAHDVTVSRATPALRRGHLEEIYGTQVSPDLISRITDAVIEDAKLWQTRPLDSVYTIV